jgi:hypothetical protein
MSAGPCHNRIAGVDGGNVKRRDESQFRVSINRFRQSIADRQHQAALGRSQSRRDAALASLRSFAAAVALSPHLGSRHPAQDNGTLLGDAFKTETYCSFGLSEASL